MTETDDCIEKIEMSDQCEELFRESVKTISAQRPSSKCKN